MRIEIDTHTHTLVSGHAYQTMKEMAYTAAEKGLKGLAITEHAPKMPGSCHEYYFSNMNVVPRQMYGIDLMLGVEVNILDENGGHDLTPEIIRDLDLSIASIHPPCYGQTKGIEKNTQAYINMMKKDYIDIIGHPDDGRFEVDYEALVEHAVKTKTLIEINNASLRPSAYRINTHENSLKILNLCKKCGAMISIGSDAHTDCDIANIYYAEKVLKEVDFPEKLIANITMERFKAVIKRNL